MAQGSFEERTERATGKRREEAKGKGQIPRSREIPSVIILLGGMVVLMLFGTRMVFQMSNVMSQWLGQIASPSIQGGDLPFLFRRLTLSFLWIAGPFLAAVFAGAVLGHTMQGSNILAWQLIKPDPGRFNLLSGLKRMFALPALVEFLKSSVKMLIVGGLAYLTIKKEWPNVLLLFGQDPGDAFHFVAGLSGRLLWRTILVMTLLAGLDYVFQRWTYEKNLRMSKQEVKEEMKQSEGDPIVKSRIRTVQRQIARRRMMAEVPKADVIITNPTHLAVALLYDNKTMHAPQVIAKGAGYLAKKIIEAAREHRVPVIENKPLARALYKAVDLGTSIPSELYHSVADLLAYVYRIRGKKL
jgi:flagellar biosynthesis protein FlhB